MGKVIVVRETGGPGVLCLEQQAVPCLRPRGLLVLFGQSSGPVPPLELGRLAEGSLFLTRPSLPHYTADRRELDIRIGNRFPLADAASAHRALESRATAGKVLLTTS